MAVALRYYVHNRINNDPAWQKIQVRLNETTRILNSLDNCGVWADTVLLNFRMSFSWFKVILSDANAPGEGEHKIMDYIRRQRASPSHDPNTVHCLCGADADLIMLGLATHEANFNIIREEFVPNQQKPCELCGQYGHELKDCQGLAADEVSIHRLSNS